MHREKLVLVVGEFSLSVVKVEPWVTLDLEAAMVGEHLLAQEDGIDY